MYTKYTKCVLHQFYVLVRAIIIHLTYMTKKMGRSALEFHSTLIANTY